jgi:hypothetical protein
MKRLSIAGLCLVSMLLASMAAAGTASAALLWLVCLEGSGLTKYESSTCLKASGTGKWQSLGVPAGASITVKILVFSILLSDEKVPIIGKSAVRCGMNGSRGEGTIEENGKGKVLVAEYENSKVNCSSEEGCGTVLKLRGIHLPWKTEIFTTESKELTKIKNGGNGEPGWEVECEPFAGIKESDKCESVAGEEEQVVLHNVVSATELLVAGLFETSHKAKCSLGGAGSGLVKGLIAILLPGGALSIRNSP